MFERFTDRAKRVAELAMNEAREMGHGEAGTEHLLIGLAVEGEGVAARALKSLAIGEAEVRAAVARRHPAGTAIPAGHIPLDRHGKKALELALREALQLGHNYIGTEHILLGLTRPGIELGVGPHALADCGIAEGDLGFLDDVRRAVIELLHGYMRADRDAQKRKDAVEQIRRRLLAAALTSAAGDFLAVVRAEADSRLLFAARDLVEAVSQLPAAERPVGWPA